MNINDLYVEEIFEDFSKKLHRIIDAIDSECDCLNDFHSSFMLLNKLNFYVENFFIDNELSKKNNSEDMQILKNQNKLFFSTIKNFQERYEKGDKNVLYEINNFLKSWLINPFISENTAEKA